MRALRLLGVLAATLSLTACLNSTTLVKLKADGSGTVEQTTLMNVAALKGMMGGANAQMNAGPMMNKADLERAAAKMGKGVRLLSTEEVKGANGFQGTKAVFGFDDINQIQIAQDPGLGSGSTGTASDDPVKFKLTRNGTTSTLAIDYNDRAVGNVPASGAGSTGDMPDLTNPMMMNMIKTMFQGFRINMGLEVVGSIVKTNAEYVQGSHITLLDMDMGTLLGDEAQMKTLQGLAGKFGPGASFADVKPYLKDIKGIKIDGPSIRVEFK
jgi:hypothetical protein